jgi:hypothetical protein
MNGRSSISSNIASREHPNQSICSQEKTCSFQARKEKFLTFRSLARLALSKRTPGGAVEGVTVEPTRCMMHSPQLLRGAKRLRSYNTHGSTTGTNKMPSDILLAKYNRAHAGRMSRSRANGLSGPEPKSENNACCPSLPSAWCLEVKEGMTQFTWALSV